MKRKKKYSHKVLQSLKKKKKETHYGGSKSLVIHKTIYT